MKKLLITFIALFMLSNYVTSQKMTFRTYQVILEFNEEVKLINNNSTIIFLDISEDKRSLYINPGYDYYITDEGELVNQGIDEDGDKYETMVFTAIDDERDKCLIFIKRWPELKYVHFYIKYNDIELTYLTKQID